MAAPTATEIRAILEGYGITDIVASDALVENYRDNIVIPHIEDITGLVFDGEAEITEYYNGNGQSILILNKRPVNSNAVILFIGRFPLIAECN